MQASLQILQYILTRFKHKINFKVFLLLISIRIRKITNSFVHANIGIAFRNNGTLPLTKPKTQYQTTEHDKSEVSQRTCNICHRSYIGQTIGCLRSRFQEHTRYIKHNEPHSAQALPDLNCKYEYSTFGDTMTLPKRIEKPSFLLPYNNTFIQLFHHNN
jgi:hypothetical protein